MSDLEPHDPKEKQLWILTEIDVRMRAQNAQYCHWKSNYHLPQAMSGIEDWDVLINIEDFPTFLTIIFDLKAKNARSINDASQFGIYHFYALDETTGTLVHIHAYVRVLSGDSLVKSYRLPFERMLLSNLREERIPVPIKEAELIVFILRNSLKFLSPLDIYKQKKAYEEVLKELEWLLDGIDMALFEELIKDYFPNVDVNLLHTLLGKIQTRASFISCMKTAFLINTSLNNFRRISWLGSQALTFRLLLRIILNKFLKKRKYMKFQGGGNIIAMIGPQAVGKSTIAKHIKNWLGAEFDVCTVHVGKPPATLLTLPFRLMFPLMRKLAPQQRSTEIEKSMENEANVNKQFSYLYILRRLILAYERRKILKWIFRNAANGSIVICDRYPSEYIGAVDGASFTPAMIESQNSKMRQMLMRMEQKMYFKISAPDIVLRLSVSVEEAVYRDQVRDKAGPKDPSYVRFRHNSANQPHFSRCTVLDFDTSDSLDNTLLTVKKKLWRFL